MSTNGSSRTLLARYQRGESDAAAEVYDRYVARLLALVRQRISPRLRQRVDAEDVVQSALRSFFVRAKNEQYVLQRAGDLWRLLATISVNKIRRQVERHTADRRSMRRERPQPAEPDLLATLGARQPQPEDEAALIDELTELFKTITAEQSQALQLRLAGETIKGIADTMSRSQRTVRRWLQQCREALEQRLE